MGVRRARGSTLKPHPGTPINAAWAVKWGLVAAYPLWTGGGIVTEDASGNGNPGTLTGFASPPIATSGWNPGLDGPALSFDTTDDYMSAALPTTQINEVSVVARIFWKGGTADHQLILFNGDPSANGYGLYIHHGVVPDDQLSLLIGGVRFEDYAVLSTNTWLDVALVRGSVTTTLYLNGASTGTTDGNTPNTPGTSLLLGGRPASNDVFNGLIDFGFLFDRALTPTQVMSLHTHSWQGFDHVLPFAVAPAAPGVTVPVLEYHYRHH